MPDETHSGVQIHPRIPPDLHRELTAYAERNGRTVANAVVHLLRQSLPTTSATGSDVHHR